MSEEILLRDDSIPPIQEELTRLYSQGFLTDITLSTEDGKNFEAHRVLLAARSHYFHSLCPRLKSESVIFLKGVKGAHLDKILKYIYGGSTSVSKHQLKPLLEVARSLQVKGLQDRIPSEVSRSGGTFGSRYKPESPAPPLRSGRPAMVDRTTITTFKTPSSRGRISRSSMPVIQNGSASDSDKEDSDNESSKEASTTPAATPTKVKRKRGRPPKNRNKDEKKEDPYEFEDESADPAGGDRASGDEATGSGSKKSSWRFEGGKRRTRGTANEEEDEDERASSPIDEEASLASRRDRSKQASSAINGKQTLTVKCKGQLAELHLSRFANGLKGLSIKYKEQWMTPNEFEQACGCPNKKYLENIQTDYGPLKTLTASGMLKPHSRKCRCAICRGEEPPSPDKKRASRRDDDEEEEEEEEEDDEAGSENPDQYKDEDARTDEERSSKKSKKRRYRDDWKRQVEAKLKREDQPPQIMPVERTPELMAAPTTPLSHISDQPPKISPSILPDRIEPPPHTVFLTAMSPHPHAMSTPATPNPFANIPPSPAPHQLQVVTSIPQTIMTVKQAPMQHHIQQSQFQPQQQYHHHQPQPQQHQQPQQGSTSGNLARLGDVLQVRCKSTTAFLYAKMYESGSKGKCIKLGDEWLTPNEFEDRAGSKAKKYLSSIKCLGRPLRVYVNSGELRGANPPHQSKMTKEPKPKTPQPIAPAPIQAPPTPSHISSAPQIPANLNMVMQPGQQQILFNQTSMGSLGNPPIITPAMTFTLAPQVELRQHNQM